MLFSCGCSFTAGCGLDNPDRDTFGAIVGRKLGMEHRNIAKHSGSNFSIMHQILHAVENKAELVLIGTTTADRYDWVQTGRKLDHTPTLKDFNYHGYHPYTEWAHPFVGDSGYKPVILSDSFASVFDFERQPIPALHDPSNYFARRLGTEIERIQTFRDFVGDLYDHNIKVSQDRAYILMGIRELERATIPFIMIDSFLGLSPYITDKTSYVGGTLFGDLCNNYPDSQGTLHFNEQGHEIVANLIIYLNSIRV